MARAAQPRDEAAETCGGRGRTRRRQAGTERAATKRWVKQWAPHAPRLWLGAVLEEEAPAANAEADAGDDAEAANDTTANVKRLQQYWCK